MVQSKDFFRRINFDFDNELRRTVVFFDNNPKLTQKTRNKTFRYTPLNEKTQCVFTLVDAPNLSDDDIFEIRKYIWNENKSDLLFIHYEDHLQLLYSFSDPSEQPIELDTFTGKEDDNQLLDKIDKSNFDTGLFWEIYREKQQQIKRKRLTVDKGLVKTLRQLREKLQKEYYSIISDEKNRDEIVQALIDRTLFIKFLEDKHIINSFFYGHYFSPNDTYIKLLKSHRKDEINKLFHIINQVFNNSLFENPHIPGEHLLDSALNLIGEALERKNFETGQLSLFGYCFDVMPIEFIGHVYEMFFDEQQSKQGIFYTPEGLAKLIVDETINETGKILDPSCGSGIFLVVGLRKLLKIEGLYANASVEDIAKRNKILSENIFGIEKQANARRLAILSLYLELLDGINPDEIKKFIKNKIETEAEFKIFPYDFASNIIHGNALNVTSINGVGKFEYIIGNPPFLQIREGEEEETFWRKHKGIVSNKQLSQCFFIKVQEWCTENEKTVLGFVSNLSSFNSDTSKKFQFFFYEKYRLIKFYNLSDIKEILFENAKESIVVILFSSNPERNNSFKFLSPKLTNFSKLFKIVLLRENELIEINQSELIDGKILLRDYFIGEEQDMKLTDRISKRCDSMSDYLLENAYSGTRFSINNGIQIVGSGNRPENWSSFSKKEKLDYEASYAKEEKDDVFFVPFLKCSNIEPFRITGKYKFFEPDIETKKNVFERVRNNDDYVGKRILLPRTGTNLKAVYVDSNIYYCFDIYSLKLKDSGLYPLFTAIINSDLMNYYLTIKHRKRVSDSFPKITMNDIIQLPIPILYDKELISKISQLATIISSENSFESRKGELNNLIFDLYGLNKFDRQRILDFSINSKIVSDNEINDYIMSFKEIIKNYINDRICIKETKYVDKKLNTSFVGIKIEFLSEEKQNIPIKKVVDYTITHLVKEIGNENIHTMKEKIYGKNCIYIVRENNSRNWSKSKAFDDAKIFLNDLLR